MAPEQQQGGSPMVEFQPVCALFSTPVTEGCCALLDDALPEAGARAVALFFQLGYIPGCLLAGQVDQRQGIMGAARRLDHIHRLQNPAGGGGEGQPPGPAEQIPFGDRKD